MKRTKKWLRNRYLIPLLALLLSGCSAKPDPAVLGLRRMTAEEVSLNLTERALQETVQEKETKAKELSVFVCGAVKNPGVYQLREGARIYEALEAAGGFLADADTEWLNQAELLCDGQKLVVLTREQIQEQRSRGVSENWNGQPQVAGEDGRINLNTATREQLMSLPGIGEAKADAVLEYRQQHGSFQAVEEIMQISGIKEAVFFKIKDRITV